jgi:hypothetical protein
MRYIPHANDDAYKFAFKPFFAAIIPQEMVANYSVEQVVLNVV